MYNLLLIEYHSALDCVSKLMLHTFPLRNIDTKIGYI